MCVHHYLTPVRSKRPKKLPSSVGRRERKSTNEIGVAISRSSLVPCTLVPLYFLSLSQRRGKPVLSLLLLSLPRSVPVVPVDQILPRLLRLPRCCLSFFAYPLLFFGNDFPRPAKFPEVAIAIAFVVAFAFALPRAGPECSHFCSMASM